MQRIKNDNNISLIKVNKFSNDHDYKFVDYYIEYNSLIYGNEDYNKSYILISLDKDKYDFYFNELDKKIQLEQFEQIITTFDLIKNK